jgi:hypothetical protein
MILLPLLSLLSFPSVGFACSCFGPGSFCETLDPPQPEPQWWTPDAVVLGVKVGAEAHGMDVRVLQVFSGSAQADDTLRVWGDTGLLCRMYADSWEIGDTVVWGFRYTDQMGGTIEQPGDFLISICGTYWLEYEQGIVSGPIVSEDPTSMTIDEFMLLVDGCLTTSLAEMTSEAGAMITVADGILEVSTSGHWADLKYVRVSDLSGRLVAADRFTGPRGSLPMHGVSSAVFVVEVADGRRSVVRRVLQE